jgi:hypothetical protein
MVTAHTSIINLFYTVLDKCVKFIIIILGSNLITIQSQGAITLEMIINWAIYIQQLL